MSRNSFIDLWRFAAMLMIMGHHQYHLGATGYPFSYGWVFVEFFFILTGYLTTVHFAKSGGTDLESRAKKAISYTIHKFVPLLPFVWTAVLLEYGYQFILEWLTVGIRASEFIAWAADLPLELLLLGSSYTKPELVPLWYLSAMFIVFPLYCLLLQAAKKHLVTIIAFTAPVLYYGAFGVADNWTFPLNLCRALAAMLLGTLIFEMNNNWLPSVYSKLDKRLLTAVQAASFALPLVACYKGAQYVLRPIVLCFVVGLALSFSGVTAMAAVQSKAMEYLGKISMPVYLFHWVVAGVVGTCLATVPQTVRISVYYIGSIVVAIAAYEIHYRIKVLRRRKLKVS